MAAIAILDLLRKNPNFGGQAFSSRGLFYTKFSGASTAAASFAITTPFAFGAYFGNGASRVSYCDAGVALDEDYISSSIRSASANIFQSDALRYTTKHYDIELKPLLSAFHWKTLAVTTLRSFLLFYLPLLEPKEQTEEDDEDFLENPEEEPLDLVVPFKKSVNQVIRETSVVTTRRVFERLAVHYVSQRMAWKLLKDVPKSAARKAARRLPVLTYFCCVSKTTFRGHLLAVLASWTVQVSIDIYRFFASISKSNKDADTDDTVETVQQVRLLGKRICSATLKCGASLILASVGAMFIRPSIGQWIGCGLGDLGGPVIVTFVLEKLHIEL